MTDPKRVESTAGPDQISREGQAEALLVEGLDRYFAGQYDEAIHIWTRVLFLDRSHARARAYIDRARTALAERQRRGEEMLQTTGELLAQGHTSEARDLLTRAVATSGDDVRGSALRSQIERLERAHGHAGAANRAAVAVVDAVPMGKPARRSRRLLIAVAGLALLVLLGVALWSSARLELTPGTDDLTAVAVNASRPVLSSSEVALVRGRTLYSQGRLAEALTALDRVDADSPSRPTADALRIEIQQLLLATGRRTPPAAGRPEASRP